MLGAGAFGAALLILMLWRGVDEALPWSLISLGIAYTLSLVLHGGPVDSAAPLLGVGLIACAELAVWSLEERQPVPAERQVVMGRFRALGALAGSGLVASGLVIALSAAPSRGGLAWTALGAAAAVLVVAVAALLVHRAG